ncbi:MAG TPA: hypothetical protein VHM92_06615 [Allosphingosinicella sp.]|nr:hypothetical protein [Allosphingosinicella sp.]
MVSTSCQAGGRAGPDIAQFCKSAPLEPRLTELVSASNLIVGARAQVPKEALIAAAKSASAHYIDVPLRAIDILKGSVRGNGLTVSVFPQDRPYAPGIPDILAADENDRIFFLTYVDEGSGGIYFAGRTPDALRPADRASIRPVRREIARQARFLRSWKPDKSLPSYREVGMLIDGLAHITRTGPGTNAERNAQADVFRRLEALGEPAVPAIIAQMDDRRPLAFQEISLVNTSPDGFEGLRHYGPELIVDALDAVLNQITGHSFGEIVNGASERQRRGAVDGWRIFAASRQCAEAARRR